MFTPHTNKDVAEMLKTIGVEHLSDLFTDIPEEHRYPKLALPENLSEMEVMSSAALMNHLMSSTAF